jgi:hypothetical protein
MIDSLVYLGLGLVLGAPVPAWMYWFTKQEEVNSGIFVVISLLSWILWPITFAGAATITIFLLFDLPFKERNRLMTG